jgi:hypothetical protein
MEYGKIVSTGWKQAWKHKTLWIFGFLISGGAGGNFGNISDDLDKYGLGGGDLYHVKAFILEHLYIIAILGLLLAVIVIIWIILSMMATGGLIHAAGQLKKKEPYSFTKCWNVGFHYFWRILGISLLTFVVIFALVILLILIGVVAFLIHWTIGVLSLLFLIPILIVSIFGITLTVSLAERYIVLEDRFVFDAIPDGFALWKSNLGSSIIYVLIYLGIGIAVFLATIVIVLFTVMPFIAIGFYNLLVALLLGIPLVLLILVVVEGFSGSALHLMTTEFFFQLREKAQPAIAPATGPGEGFTPPPQPPPPPPPPPVT